MDPSAIAPEQWNQLARAMISLYAFVGLALVLSTTVVYALDTGQAPYKSFQVQLVGALVGLVLMWLAAKAPPRLFRAVRIRLIEPAREGPEVRRAG